MNFITITTTFEVREEAKKMADMLVDEKLVACGQICEIESFYTWKGEKVVSKEFLLTLKTRESLFKEVEKFIKKHHSYEVAEIVATPIYSTTKEYGEWIENCTKKK